jgi:hypothetical protein
MTNMDKLYEAVEARGPVCVGLDTDFSYLPADFVDSTLTKGENIVRFNKKLIDATKAVAGCYKVQIAYYESLGLEGMKAYAETLAAVREAGIPVIADIKRGDIAKTAEMYAMGHFTGDFEADFVTLDVGDDRHTGLPDSLQGVGIGLQTLEAKRLVVSDLHLVAARDGLGGVDELLVEAHDVLALGEGAVHEICGQVAEIGVQTHADRAACFDCFVKLIHVRHLGFLLFASLFISISSIVSILALSVTAIAAPPLPKGEALA